MRRGTASSFASALSVPKGTRRKPCSVAVLLPSHDKDSTWAVDVGSDECTPAHWVQRHKKFYKFESLTIRKSTTWKQVRELVSQKKYDVFYNLCDGAKDEDRPGIDVIQALEASNVPYTGADGRGFEPSKIDMKMVLAPTGVKYPNFVPLHPRDNIGKLCKHLKFPVIVKHHSGYGSIGITAKSKCHNIKDLKVQCKWHIEEYNHALVEEFISGREGTVFVCADPNSASGVKVFPPIMMELGGPDDFAHFDNKWINNSHVDASTVPKGLDLDDPAQDAIKRMAKAAFKMIMHNVGYGRVDFRLDEKTGDPYFLEINPNCGMLYPKESGGCYADVMVGLDKEWDHDTFITTQIEVARQQQMARATWTDIAYTTAAHKWTARATRRVPRGTRLFPDSTKVIPVVLKAHFDVNDPGHVTTGASGGLSSASESFQLQGSSDQVSYTGEVSCAVYRADGISDTMVPLQHSCNPNMVVEHGQTLSVVSRTAIKSGTFLTLDYSSLRDRNMPAFNCHCGSRGCQGVVRPQPIYTRNSQAVNSNSGKIPTNDLD